MLCIVVACWNADPTEFPEVIVWVGANCPACEGFKPIVQQLQAEGWPIKIYSRDQYPAQAAGWKVHAIPSTIVHTRVGEVARCVGSAGGDWVRLLMRACGVRRR